MPRVAKVDAFEKHRELRWCDLAGGFCALRPCKPATVESLCEEAQAAAVPVHRLDAVSGSVAEEHEIAVEDVSTQIFFDDARETIEGLAQIGRAATEVDARSGREPDQSSHAARMR